MQVQISPGSGSSVHAATLVLAEAWPQASVSFKPRGRTTSHEFRPMPKAFRSSLTISVTAAIAVQIQAALCAAPHAVFSETLDSARTSCSLWVRST
jgi:hypothetical protein